MCDLPIPSPFRSISSLEEIRILHVEAGEPSDPLRGRLGHARLDQSPRYEALSYEWGSGTKNSSLLLENGLTLPITESLRDALRDLRREPTVGESRAVWADAVCINQQDIAEVQDQVSIMASIYRAALRVVTYIGPERDGSTAAISFARELDRIVQTRSNEPLERSRGGEDLSKYPLPPLSDSRWNSLKALIVRTWASRCWCAHEFILNRELILMCGKEEIEDWYIICEIVRLVFNRSLPAFLLPAFDQDPLSLRECLVSLYRLRLSTHRSGGHNLNLLALLQRLHPFRASDPRDKVYSVLGLANDRQDLGLTVDYTCTVEQLYIKTATQIIRTSSNINILLACLHIKSLVLPSWVPDWSHWEFGSYGTTLSKFYNVCGTDEDGVRVCGNQLQVAGCLIDEIEYASEAIGPNFVTLDQGLTERRAWLRKEYDEITQRLEQKGYSDEEMIGETFWRTLIGNITLWELPATYAYQAFFNALVEYSPNDCSLEKKDMAQEFCDAVRRRSRYRRLAVTKKGYIGAVPITANQGDVVCMIHGGALLFALRPRGLDFTYLGHAYVHGLMNGEVVKAEWYKKQIITLV